MKTSLSFVYSFTYALVNFSEALIILATLGIYSPCWVMSFAAWYSRRTLRSRMLGVNEASSAVSELRSMFPLLNDDGLDEDEHCCEWVIQQERKRLHAFLDEVLARVGGEA